MRIVASYNDYASEVEKSGDIRIRMLAYQAAHAEVRFEHIHACENCGFHHIFPMPNADALNHFYQNYGGNVGYAKKEKRKIQRTQKRLRRIARYVAGGTFLDVGANMGFAVQAAHCMGFIASGIEIDSSAVAQASARYPHNQFIATRIEDFAPASAFDLVHCTEVIEHVPDAHSFVLELARLTKKGGYLFLTTPDGGHWRVPKNFVQWPEVKPPEHVAWFTKKSLRHILESHGFEVVHFGWNLKPGLRVLARKKA